MYQRVLTVAALTALCLASTAVADEVHLTDGSKIVGKVAQIAGGKVTVKTEFAGDLTIDAAKVKGITTDAPVNVQVQSGERAVGKLEYDAGANQQNVSGELAGKKAVPVAQVASVWPQGAEDPAIAELKAKEPHWKLRLDLGLNGETGNSDRFSLLGKVEAKRVAPGDRLTLYGSARYSHENGQDTASEFIAGASLEVDINDRLYWYLRGEFEADDFENLDFRATLTGGVGYFFIKEKITEFKGRVGAGYQFESFQNGTNTEQVVLEFGIDYRRDITPWLSYEHHTTVYPSLEDIRDFRLVMENLVAIPLTNDKMWKLKIGVKNQYDGDTNPGVRGLDTYYFATLGVDF